MHSYTFYLTQVANQDLDHHQSSISLCYLYSSSRMTVFSNLKKNAAPFPNVNSKWWYTKERLNLWEIKGASNSEVTQIQKCTAGRS